jgi:hypothetical protein
MIADKVTERFHSANAADNMPAAVGEKFRLALSRQWGIRQDLDDNALVARLSYLAVAVSLA